jgi:hypothetical protein
LPTKTTVRGPATHQCRRVSKTEQILWVVVGWPVAILVGGAVGHFIALRFRTSDRER